jgi:LacI family transcriptional regulator
LASEIDAVRVLRDKRVDGLIVAPASSTETAHLKQVQESGLPLIFIDRTAAGLDVETVAVDMVRISREATRHLLDTGHRRVAFVSTLKTDAPYRQGMTLDSSQIADRLEGMRQAFLEAELPFPEDLVRLNAGDAESIGRITREVLRGPDRATAVVASDGLIALSIVEAIQELGVTIPADLSFLMYDDFPWTRLTTPPLTVIAQPVYNMGMAAGKALIRKIQGLAPAAPAPQFTATLIRRGSVGPLLEPVPAPGKPVT